jgi:hypothetical protein
MEACPPEYIAEFKLEEVDNICLNPKSKKPDPQGNEGDQEIQPFTQEHIIKLVDHMEKMQGHDVFYSGRSFVQEGFGVSEIAGSVVFVKFYWGS